jgi:hypothetical protein
MSGLFVAALALAWLAAAIMLSRWVGRRFKQSAWQAAAALAAFALVLPLPVADELIGMRQFATLCQEGAVLKIDAERIKGKSVRLVISPSGARVDSTVIPITYSHFSYRELQTNDELASYQTYSAKGGLVVRALGIFERDAPLISNRAGCAPQGHATAFSKQYGFSVVN